MARRAVEIPIKLKLDKQEAIKDMEEFGRQTTANVTGFQSAKRILEGLEKSIHKAFDPKSAGKFDAQIVKIQESASKTANSLLNMKDAYKEALAKQAIRDAFSTPEAKAGLTADYERAQKTLQSVYAQMEKLSQGPAQGRNDYWVRMNEGYQTALRNLQHYHSERAKIEQSGGKGSDEWKRLSEAMTKARRQMAGYKSQMKTAMSAEEIAAAQQKLERMRAVYDSIKQELAEITRVKRIAESSSIVDDTTIQNVERLTVMLKAAEMEIEKFRRQNEELDKKGQMNNLRSSFYLMRTVINDMERAIGSLKEKLKNFVSGITKAAKSMLGLGKESTKTTNTLNDGFKNALRNILRYGFGIRSLYFLFRRLRKYAKEALDEMAKQIPQVNAQMSRAAQSLNQMKGALATAIQPLLNVIVPVLEKIAALITRIMNTIGGVFAIFTGQKAIYTATAGAVDYAASLEKTGKAAKDAKKELEGYLSPIDEINKYQSQKDDDKDKDSGGGAGAPAFTYAESPIPDLAKKIADLIKRLIEPIKKAWARVGDFVKKSWKYAMDEVLKLGQSFARDFWRMWEQEATVKVFENIFEAVGWIGVAVGNLAKRFREAWDENDTGFKILCAIRDIVLIITEHVKNMAKATAEWADKLDFSPLLTAFQKWLESMKPVVDAIAGVFEDFYTDVILPLTKWSIEKGLPELLKVFTDFNNEVDWDGLREKLSRLWEHLEPFAERVGEGLIMFIDDVMDRIAEFINNGGMDKLIDNLNEFMDSVSAEDVKDTIWGIVNALIALQAASSVVGVLGKVALALKEISMVVANWSAISGVLATLGGIASFITGLVIAVKEFFDMWTNGWDGLSTILEALGIALAVIGAIILGAPALIAAVIGGIIFLISQLVIVIHDNWDAIKQFFVDLWDGIVDLWNGLVDWVNSNIVQPLLELNNALKERINAIFEGLWIIIKAIWIKVSGWFNQNVVQPVVNFFSPIVAKISGFFQTLWNKIKSIWNVVANWFRNTVITPIQNAFSTFINTVSGFFSKLWNGIKDGAKAAFNGVIGFIERAINGIINGVNKFFDLFNSAVRWAASITGDSWSGISLISPVSLPRLAQGAVIPPNKEFMAVLGDQNRGTNIETPLQTMIDAFNTALSQNGGNQSTTINFVLPDRRKIAQYVLEGGRVIQTSTGRNPFDLA